MLVLLILIFLSPLAKTDCTNLLLDEIRKICSGFGLLQCNSPDFIMSQFDQFHTKCAEKLCVDKSTAAIFELYTRYAH